MQWWIKASFLIFVDLLSVLNVYCHVAAGNSRWMLMVSYYLLVETSLRFPFPSFTSCSLKTSFCAALIVYFSLNEVRKLNRAVLNWPWFIFPLWNLPLKLFNTHWWKKLISAIWKKQSGYSDILWPISTISKSKHHGHDIKCTSVRRSSLTVSGVWEFVVHAVMWSVRLKFPNTRTWLFSSSEAVS